MAAMNPLVLLFLLSSLSIPSLSSSKAQPAKPNSQITVMGIVYCDICSNNTFSRHSYFLPGAEVKIDCRFKVLSPRTTEEISFSVKRTTNKFGVYKLEIPSIDGIQCAAEPAIESACQASLMGSSSSSCNVPGYKTTSDEITIKSKQANLCIYSLNALNFRPSKRDKSLCGNEKN
ncbi:pollen-specific protein-like At4g18596 [Malania oleifera]|uniref:pollen-specific protein-like At4g18596 n=1 Tax=Malania oleifera TaxID=397392 RepID=UPI0025ADE5D9|nr:pollen-specific protein-like At4g18596 [Malania oleifera]XP_057982629.1 pollen-specific protein-like At4g18596 [Malania oleifera]